MIIAPRHTTSQQGSSKRVRVCIIAPSLRYVGGQSVQADLLQRSWDSDPDVHGRRRSHARVVMQLHPALEALDQLTRPVARTSVEYQHLDDVVVPLSGDGPETVDDGPSFVERGQDHGDGRVRRLARWHSLHLARPAAAQRGEATLAKARFLEKYDPSHRPPRPMTLRRVRPMMRASSRMPW